jgi:hypothetical protein
VAGRSICEDQLLELQEANYLIPFQLKRKGGSCFATTATMVHFHFEVDVWSLCQMCVVGQAWMTWVVQLTTILLFAHLCSRSHSTLIIDEDFDNLDAWNQDKTGITATIKIIPSEFDGTQTMLSTNVSYCGNDSCYRAEITTPPAMRPSVIPGTTGRQPSFGLAHRCVLSAGVYWFGFSNYIPADWQWLGQTNQGYSEVLYYFQFHGGDNNGQPPVWGLRNIGPFLSLSQHHHMQEMK